MDNPLSGEPVSEADNYSVLNGLHRQWCEADESARPAIEEVLFKALYHYAVRLCSQRFRLNDADLTGLAASKALEGMASYTGANGAKFTSWAYRVLMNTFIDDLKWRQRWLGQEFRLEDHDKEDKNSQGSSEYERDEKERDKREETVAEAQIKVRQLMLLASPLQRELLEARMHSDSLQGAADRIGISKSAAQSRWESFRGALRRKGIEFKSRLSLYDWENTPSHG